MEQEYTHAGVLSERRQELDSLSLQVAAAESEALRRLANVEAGKCFKYWLIMEMILVEKRADSRESHPGDAAVVAVREMLEASDVKVYFRYIACLIPTYACLRCILMLLHSNMT